MSSLSKLRTASIVSNAGRTRPTPTEIGWIKNKGKGNGKEKGKEKEKQKGKVKERGKGRKDEQNTKKFEGT